MSQLATSLTTQLQSSRLGDQVSTLHTSVDNGFAELSGQMTSQHEIIADSRMYIGEVRDTSSTLRYPFLI